uniref:Uncharacterized protein n=1 Tax=viral metagenome TaxID=1070528 RepID=A0A6C0AEV3_9ZZZZ
MLYKNIPKYLHNSEFYLNLDPLDEEFEIPEKYFKKDENINSFEDCVQLFNIYEFFGVSEIPEHIERYQDENIKEVVNYLLKNKQYINNLSKFDNLLSIYKYIPGYSVYGLDLNGVNLFLYLSKYYIRITILDLAIKMKIETIEHIFTRDILKSIKNNEPCKYGFFINCRKYKIEYKDKFIKIIIQQKLYIKIEYKFEYNEKYLFYLDNIDLLKKIKKFEKKLKKLL